MLPWLAQESPGRLIPALTRFVTCSPAWDAHEIATAIGDVIRRRGHDPHHLTSHRITTRPAIVLAAVLRDLDQHADHPRGLETDPWTTTQPEPCGSSGCDNGWITLTAGNGTGAVAPCLTCDPAVRAGWAGWAGYLPDDRHDGEEPPF